MTDKNSRYFRIKNSSVYNNQDDDIITPSGNTIAVQSDSTDVSFGESNTDGSGFVIPRRGIYMISCCLDAITDSKLGTISVGITNFTDNPDKTMAIGSHVPANEEDFPGISASTVRLFNQGDKFGFFIGWSTAGYVGAQSIATGNFEASVMLIQPLL